MSIDTFLVLAVLAEFLAVVSIILCIWIWLTQKKSPSDELNRNAVGHRVHTMQAHSVEDEASVKAPTGPKSKSRESIDTRAQSSPTEPRPRPIQRPE
jgi:hypothetical protein